MTLKNILKRTTAVLMVFLIMVFNTSVGAAQQTARLRECLESDHVYLVLTPDILSKSVMKNTYADRYIAFSGTIRYSSVAKNHKSVTVYGSSNGVDVDTSSKSVINLVNSLKMGDRVTVFGQVDGSEINAEHLLINPSKEPTVLSSVYYPNKEITDRTITDLARDGHVRFKIPVEWDNEYVSSRLTNNDVNGYQFFLNALYPQNRNYPENFYIFYFGYETYLDQPPKNPTSGDHQDIEELVMNNILGVLSGEFEYSIKSLKLSDGKKYDYCTTVYKPKDGNDYRLEFMFKPDPKGLVCMLYLYYPNDNAVNHLQDVAFLVQSVEN